MSFRTSAFVDSKNSNEYVIECSDRTTFTVSPPHARIFSSEASVERVTPSSPMNPPFLKAASGSVVASVGSTVPVSANSTPPVALTGAPVRIASIPVAIILIPFLRVRHVFEFHADQRENLDQRW